MYNPATTTRIIGGAMDPMASTEERELASRIADMDAMVATEFKAGRQALREGRNLSRTSKLIFDCKKQLSTLASQARRQCGLSSNCDLCRNLDPAILDEPRLYIYRRDYDDIKDFAKSGCPFCSLMIKIIEKFSSRPPFLVHLLLQKGVTPRLILDEDEYHTGHEEIEIITPLGLPQAGPQFLVRLNVYPDPLSEESLWFPAISLRRCISQHELCRQSWKPKSLPKRVLDVGISSNPNTIKLIETEPSMVPLYIALSYCWGKAQNFITTTANIAERKSGIGITDLPSCLRDAILATRKLCIPYLWIDALCIIQDSVEDWELQAAQMGDIYQHAYLTIAASRSSACDEHFLGTRERFATKEFTLKSPIIKPRRRLVGARRIPQSGYHCGLMSHWDRDPWAARAWTLQESLSSTRLLVYSSDEMQWSCKTEIHCECGGQQYKGPDVLGFAGYPTQLYQSDGSKIDMYRYWHLQIEEYTKRQITYSKDRLPALSGSAKFIHEYTASKYIAGLWENNLLADLLWKLPTYGRGLRYHWAHPTSYRAPSFSWASVDGAINYKVDDPLNVSPWKFCASVEATHCTVSERNPFGEVTYCSVHLKGPLVQTSISKASKDHNFSYTYTLSMVDGKEIPLEADVRLETFAFGNALEGDMQFSARRYTKNEESIFDSTAVVWMLCLAETEPETKDNVSYCKYHVLVLGRSSTESDAYERLGFLELFSRSDFFSGDARTIKLV